MPETRPGSFFFDLFQRLVNVCYRFPKSELKKYRRFGGYGIYREMQAGKKQMAKAACRLPPVRSYNDGLPVYFLTGKDYLYQTLFCIRSLSLRGDVKFRFTLVDDGSFNEAIVKQIQSQLPQAEIIMAAEIAKNIDKHLPPEGFPNIHRKRKVYAHLKKLTDIHTLPGEPWKMVLDSDMLFWKEPAELISWLKNPTSPLALKDCMQSYGYDLGLMQALSGGEIEPLLNVGAVGLNSLAVNWDKLEKWIGELEAAGGASYYLEQALTAMLIGETPLIMLPGTDYIVCPSDAEMMDKTGILHHYVDTSKKGYFIYLWKELIQQAL